MTPEHIGEWRIERLLGHGGMAEVYEAAGPGGERVALKWLRGASPTLLSRFADEARFLERLAHPNVVRHRGHGIWEGRPYVLMEHVDGPDLRIHTEKLRSRPPIERHARVRAIARDLCRALGHVHAQGIIHRDVKPSNVLIAADGRVVLSDFGVACADDAPITAMGMLVGTAAYAAPEQLSGEAFDARVDQYGLGCTLYYVLTGRRPFLEDTTAGLVHAHLDHAPRPPSDRDPTIPTDLDDFVLRLLAKVPADRFRDMAEAEASIGAGPAPDLPLAGRQAVIDAIAGALDRVAAGERVVLHLTGARGSGRRWVEALARDAAERRGLDGLVLTRSLVEGAETLALGPLTVADVRRSTYAFAPKTVDLARVSERLHRESGGNPGLFLQLVQRTRIDERIVLPDGPPEVDVDPWIGGLDLDECAVAGALALLRAPADARRIEDIAQVPPEESLAALEARAVASRVGNDWVLAAEAFRQPLLDALPDLEAMEARATIAPEASAPADALLAEATTLGAAGRFDAAEAILRAGVQPGAPNRAARLLALGGLLWTTGEAARARAAHEEAALLAHGTLLGARASIGAGVCALQAGDLQDALDRLTTAVTETELLAEPEHLAIALFNLSEARALHGELADALRAARRALNLAQGLRNRAIECAALRHLGQVLLDVGCAAEAGRSLADASAIARAGDMEAERFAAHFLRARATLEERPQNRTAAATALDRLLPLLQIPPPDPEGIGLLVRCVWAQAAAVLGDRRMYARAVAEAEARLPDQRRSVRTRAEVLLARAALVAGDRAGAEARAARVVAEAEDLRLFAWEAARVGARARNTTLPGAGALAAGLDPAETAALERRV